MKDKFGIDYSALEKKKLFLLDMDGTIYLGNRLFPETMPFLKKIVDRGGNYVFITNNSSKSVIDYVNKLHRLGITEVSEKDFFTSAQAAALLLKERYPQALIYAQGTRSFIDGLRKDGLNITEEIDDNISLVLVGFDTELTMEKLTKTCKILTKNPGIPYYATNPDWVCPTEWGSIPDCGSMCFGIEKATGRKPIFIGKPAPTMIQYVMKKYGRTEEETVVVGDRLYTDIKSGNRAGVSTVCVLSGEVTFQEVKDASLEEKPTYCLDDVGKILF